MTEPKIQKRKITDYKPDPANANKGTERGWRMVNDSLQEDGAGRSIVVAADGTIVAGNKTAENAVDVGITEVIEVETDGHQLVVVKRTDWQSIDDPSARRYAYRDNRAGELSLEWDAEQLLADLNAEILPTGLFNDDELAVLLGDLLKDETPVDVEPQLDRAEQLRETWQTARGQVWEVPSKTVKGKAHRLMCGDSTSREDVGRLMNGQKADALINDPPYGMRLDADFSGMVNKLEFTQSKGVKSGRKYENVIGDHEDYDASPVIAMFTDIKEQFWFGADYYSNTLGDTMHSGAWMVWDKRLEESADRMYGSCFELLWSKQKHKRDILRHKWAGIFGTEHEDQRGRTHPNQKPTALISDIMYRYTSEGMLIVDCYSGSGTTMVAAEQTGRICYGMEISPAYVAVTLQRLADLGLSPRLCAYD